ncbi:hypothetical protein JCM10908_000044 [Rhodotorula pacifica]|uniref:zinc finger MYND domain-containing protein n=1 Tax=Rhodotorula pacifica TaxID=1495444 RepID=UPI00316E5308
MSSSTPGTTTCPTCFVCGAESTQRCSACAKDGVSVTFCSMEHQKLVWHAHKPVCGPGKAMPFTAPSTMSKDELATLVSLLSYAYPAEPSTSCTHPTFRHMLARKLGLREDQMTNEKLEQLFTQPEPAKSARIVDSARSMMLLAVSRAWADERHAPKLQPLCFSSFIVKFQKPYASEASPQTQSELAHAALILAAAALQPSGKQAVKGPTAPTDQQLLLRFETLARELYAHQTFPDQIVASSIMDTLRRAFLNLRPFQSDFNVMGLWSPTVGKMIDVRMVPLAEDVSHERGAAAGSDTGLVALHTSVAP